MRYLRILSVWLLWPICLSAQDANLFAIWTDSALRCANTASQVDYMSEAEKEVVLYINLCRMNPPLFESTYLKDYLTTNKVKRDEFVKSLQTTLRTTSPMLLLAPSSELTAVARAHAADMGTTGRTGHNSSNGATFHDRMVGIANSFRGLNENANYGMEKPLDIVIDLLIDRNVPNAGHRRNMLATDMRFVGVAIEPHKKWRINCVQDFGGERVP